MKLQRFHSVCFAALSSTLLLLGLFSDNVAATTDDTTFRTTSMGCVPDFIGDGDCDQSNNFEDCGGRLLGCSNEKIADKQPDDIVQVPIS